MNIDLISKMIESSPDRERIELDLTILFGEKDIRKIHHPNLDVFIEDVGRAWELVEFSFFSKYANPLYPEETCSPLGMIVGKFHM